MAQTYRAQIAVWHDSLDPRDAMCVDPCFHDFGPTSAPQSLSDDLATAVNGKIAGAPQIRVRFYKLPYTRGEGHVAETLRNKGTSPASDLPREQALCLSFYSGENKPRKRGRLYLPIMWLGLGYGGVRPTTPMMTAALGWRTILTGLGGVDVDWSVWSTVNQSHHPVTDCWVDNEHDTVRSRGLRGTSRILATTSEGDLPNLVRLSADAPPVTAEEQQAVADALAA